MDRDELRDRLLALRKRLTIEELDYAIKFLNVEEKRVGETPHTGEAINFVRKYCKFGPKRVYLLMAVARSKNNPLPSSEGFTLRKVIKDEKDIQKKYHRLKTLATNHREGYSFYLYLSANPRSVRKTYFNFRNRMNGWVEERLNGAENHEKFKKLDRYWLSELSKPASRDETNLLVDVDDEDELSVEDARNILAEHTEILTQRKTPNGFHIVVKPFNYEDLSVDLDIKTDALLFLEHICKE